MNRILGISAFLAIAVFTVNVQPVQAQWTQNGVAICTAPGAEQDAQVISDGAGGAIVTWVIDKTAIGVQRINAGGYLLWAIEGVIISGGGPAIYGLPQPVSDGAGGAIITWQKMSYTPFASYDLYAQRIDANGNILWRTGGVPICTSALDQTYPQVVSRIMGGQKRYCLPA